jgi:hypothetical protein
MTSDFDSAPGIADAASGAVGGELAFTFPGVLEVIHRCTACEIAVLGVEVFEVRREGCSTKSLSGYERETGSGPKQKEGWAEYVRANNLRAEDYAKRNRAGDDHIYVLTAVSWKEFRELKAR